MQPERIKVKVCEEVQAQIYIVDDDVSVCRALKLLLITYGFTVDTFSSSDEFFKQVTADDPGCLILDIHMPGLNGWALLQRLYSSGSKRHVIVVSADKNGGLRERALQTGAAGFLQKPFLDEELIELVNKTC